MKNNKTKKQKEIYKSGTWLTIFENGDVYVSTKGDVHIIEARQIFDTNDRIKTIIESEDNNLIIKKYNDDELEIIKKFSK